MTTPAPEPPLAGFELLEQWLAHRQACLAAATTEPATAQPG